MSPFIYVRFRMLSYYVDCGTFVVPIPSSLYILGRVSVLYAIVLELLQLLSKCVRYILKVVYLQAVSSRACRISFIFQAAI